MLGFIIGAVSGTIQSLLLPKFTDSAKSGKVGKKTLLFIATQFLFPFIVLLLCAFFLMDELVPVVIGMAAAIIICSLIKFIIATKAGKR